MESKIEQYLGGSVSHGTLIAHDLIEKFEAVLADVNPNELEGLKFLYSESARIKGSDTPEDEAMYLGDLMDALDDQCPAGYYFGAHEDDGADFGFWAWLEEDELPY